MTSDKVRRIEKISLEKNKPYDEVLGAAQHIKHVKACKSMQKLVKRYKG